MIVIRRGEFRGRGRLVVVHLLLVCVYVGTLLLLLRVTERRHVRRGRRRRRRRLSKVWRAHVRLDKLSTSLHLLRAFIQHALTFDQNRRRVEHLFLVRAAVLHSRQQRHFRRKVLGASESSGTDGVILRRNWRSELLRVDDGVGEIHQLDVAVGIIESERGAIGRNLRIRQTSLNGPVLRDLRFRPIADSVVLVSFQNDVVVFTTGVAQRE